MPATSIEAPPLLVRSRFSAASEFDPPRRTFRARMRRAPLLAIGLLALAGCGSQAAPTPPDKPAASSSAAPAISASASPIAPAPKGPLAQREGQALVRSPNEAALYLADEDHSALRRVALTHDLTDAP